MNIHAVPDSEDEEFDPVDPLGSIRIQNDEGSEFLARSVFLDDWFEGLLSGLRNTRSGRLESRIELSSSRDPLIWKADESGAVLQYKTHTLRVRDLDAFERALRQAVIEFTKLYTIHKNWPKCKTLSAMREWALNEQAG